MEKSSAWEDDLPGRAGSFWTESTPITSFPPLSGDREADVAVIGGGIAGITTALMLKQAGYTVAVIEADRVCRGVTGNTTAKVTSLHRRIYRHLIDHFGEEQARQYANANQAAIGMIASLVERYGISCDFYRRPAVTFAESADSRDLVMAEADAARSLGLPASYVEEIPLPVKTYGAVRFEDQAQFHPLKYLSALIDLIPGDGSSIFENTRAVEIREDKVCTVKTERGNVIAQAVVLATHYPFYDGPGFYFARMYPSRSYALGARIEEPPPEGMYINADGPVHSLRSQPAPGGDLVIVSGGEHRAGWTSDTKQFYRGLERYIRSVYTVSSIDYRWSAHDYITSDHVPYIGRLASGHDRIYVATGFGKWGMTAGTVAGMLIADLIRGRSGDWGAVFDPARFKPLTSARNFLSHNIDVAEAFIGGAISRPSGSVADIGPMEGRVIMVDNEKTAVSRDRDGNPEAVQASCTHMGCIVRWNDAEGSWDCPCHGSRFAGDGRVIHGPALKDLPRRKPREE